MVALELARLVLFVFEWTFSVVCLALFPSSLYRKTEDPELVVCAISSPSFCRFGISWTLIALMLITVCIFWHLAEYCTKFALPAFLEMLLVAFLAVWWFIGAISFTLAKKNGDIVDVTASTRSALRALSWLLVLLYAASTFVAWRIVQYQSDGAMPDTLPHTLPHGNMRAVSNSQSDVYQQYGTSV